MAAEPLAYWAPQIGEVSTWLHNHCHMGDPRVQRCQNGCTAPPTLGTESGEISKWLHNQCHIRPQNGEMPSWLHNHCDHSLPNTIQQSMHCTQQAAVQHSPTSKQ